MARWDQILSLPVQSPPTLEFSSGDLLWSKVEGWRDNIDRVALIPFARVDDFVKGESSNKDCPTRFHVEARRRRPLETTYKPKVDGILEYILYWCSFGPDDHRKGGVVRPSRNTYVPKKKSAGRPNTKRGCTCHFIVKRLIAEPSVALIIYNQDKHVDKKGIPCHGPQDKKAAGTRAMYAPYISEDLRLRVLSLLHVGVSVETIMQRHLESVEKQGGPCNRDDLLTHRYVRRQERSIRRSMFELDSDDAISVKKWVEIHQTLVFFYEDFSYSNPFVLGIQTEWQLQQMIRFGNRGLIASDSRFGTNKLKYPVHSLLVFNSDNKAIPVAWVISPAFSSGDTHRWMRALYNRVHTKDPTWKLAGFIVDDPTADIFTIREVFQCSVLICFWRVRHAWLKNLLKRCSEIAMQAEISRRLGLAVYNICKGTGTVDMFEDFMEDFVDASDFMDYFMAIWYPRIGMWTTALKTLPLASQETCTSMEFYHNQMKLRLLNEKDPTVYQRGDWLVDKLGTKVHSYFWLDEYSSRDDFSRYWKDEWTSGLTAWRKLLKIPDSAVFLEAKYAKVMDQQDQDLAHIVWNPGTEFGICDCSWAQMGNLCEHVLKIAKCLREKGEAVSSINSFQYNWALNNMLKCPPFDSLIRDRAVCLSVWVQAQLNSRIVLENRQAIGNTIEEQIENNSSFQNGNGPNGSRVADDHDLGDELNDPAVEIETGSLSNDPMAEIETDPLSNDPMVEIETGPLSNDPMVEIETDQISNCSLESTPDEVRSTNVSFHENSEITMNLPSTSEEFTDQNGTKNDILEQNGVCGNGREPSVVPEMLDQDANIEDFSPSVSTPVIDSHLIKTVEASNRVSKENGEKNPEIGSVFKMGKNVSSPNEIVPMEGFWDHIADDSVIGIDDSGKKNASISITGNGVQDCHVNSSNSQDEMVSHFEIVNY